MISKLQSELPSIGDAPFENAIVGSPVLTIVLVVLLVARFWNGYKAGPNNG